MRYIDSIETAIEGLKNREMIGIGITAFNRFFPGLLHLNKYSIFCNTDSSDINILGKYCPIHVVKDDLPSQSTASILQTKDIQEHIKKHPNSRLYLYKNSNKINEICKQLGAKIIGNDPKIRDQFEDKKEFRIILDNIGIAPIPGETLLFDSFRKEPYQKWEQQYGRFVLQLPDIKNGGGQGTFFIKNENDFIRFLEKTKDGTYKKKQIEWINVTKFIDGISASITCCATKYGTLTSAIQTQIIDIPEVIHPNKGTGLFCGHDRSYKHYGEQAQSKAENIAKTLGSYMYKVGYKGIFGIDLLIENDDVYVVECNPRYTGAFPTTSIIDLSNQVIPMDIFHMYELIDIPYSFAFEEINKQYKYKKEGSHILLSNKTNSPYTCTKTIEPGTYIFHNGHIKHISNNIEFSGLQSDKEFILLDGLPYKGSKITSGDELSRFCHIIFKKNIIENNTTLHSEAREIINSIYSDYIKEGR